MARAVRRAVDLLLLNASNYAPKAVYPYAFVQVSALARRFGLKVARFDFLGLAGRPARVRLTELLAQHRPRMIGLHLRQADTVVESDYRLPPEGDPSAYYLPVDATRALVRAIRDQTEVPIVVGGFGFTTHPLPIVRRLGVDFGVLGEPDALFARFDDVLARRSLDKVDNLIYRDRGSYRANPRVFYPPAGEPEYSDEIVGEMLRFHRQWPNQDGSQHHAPVEISRGCPGRCYFCPEPSVKGRRLRERAWDAVQADILALVRRGVRRIWLVCSEINFDPKLARRVTRRMALLNRGRQQARRIHWRAYNLPRMSRADLRAMLAAGFEPGWNDFASFDDQNLRRCRVPYRAKDAIAYCRDFHELAAKVGRAQHAQIESQDAKTFYLFLGNALSDPQTISTTLRKVDRHGLASWHTSAAVVPATRVFEIDGSYNCGTDKSIVSIGRRGRAKPDVVLPTFFYPPGLLAELGSPDSIREFLDYVGATFLSTRHRQDRDWLAFLRRTLTPAILRAHMTAASERGQVAPVAMDVDSDPALVKQVQQKLLRLWHRVDIGELRELFRLGAKSEVLSFTAWALLDQLLRPNVKAFRRILRHLGVPCDRDGFYEISEYRLAEILYRRYRSNEQLVHDVCQRFELRPESLDQLQLEYLLFDNSVRIDPKYRRLLFGPNARLPPAPAGDRNYSR